MGSPCLSRSSPSCVWVALEGAETRLWVLDGQAASQAFFFWAGKRRYNIKLWKTFTDCFNCLPIAAIVDEKIFCCHGGEGSPRKSLATSRGSWYKAVCVPSRLEQLSLGSGLRCPPTSQC